MINLLFINATILITFLYLGNQLFENNISKIDFNIIRQLLLGILSGLGGCILVFYGINVANLVHIDFRIIAIIVSVIYGGAISGIITTSMIALFRLSYYGVTIPSTIASVGLIVLLLFYFSLCKFKLDFIKKFSIMSLLNILYGIIVYSTILFKSHLLFKILSSYIIATLIVSILVYYILVYISKTNQLYRRLKVESTKDFLTGLNNVREFDNIINKLVNSTLEKQESLSILMIDIDFFKNINDNYGHPSGDLVLKQLSKILVDCCRSFDVISRNGGEEFTAILLDCDCKHASQIAEKIRSSVEVHTFIIENNKHINITVSIGIGSYPDSVKNINNILSEADDALYLAKRSGRNKVC
ncbi:diguanylate cyclase [Clostridium sp. C8-1-8]|uniref:diguanylate cyclase n=1 Tax=Clostridium sp. C8-1-8 TaxID=2698831 RepID=UPI00136EFFB5|nr:diguanylate cyclase [Clostridium sp. C8-1-8]